MYRSDYDDGYGRGGAYGDMRNSYEQAKANSIDTLASLGSVQENDGHYSWMGIDLGKDREIAFLLQQATSGLPTLIGEKLSNGVYDSALRVHKSLTKQLGKSPTDKSSHKFAIIAAGVSTVLLIGLQPIMTIVKAVKDRNSDRAEVHKNLKSIIDADKQYKDNEVVKTALEQSQKILTAGLKNAGGQLPTVLTNGIFAWGNHKIMAQDKHAINVMGKKQKDLPERTVNIDEKTQQFIGIGALAGNILLQRKVFKDVDADHNKPNAYKLIAELQGQITNGEIYKGTDITHQIVQIFQQNEVDRGRHAIGPALMDKFAPLAKQIGDAISNRELDAVSLINLVGGGKVINNRKFITAEQMDGLLEHEKNTFGPREKETLEELLTNYDNPKKVTQAIKDNLQNLKGDERAVFAALFSDDVLLKSGVKKKELPEIRNRSNEILSEFIKTKTEEIAGKSPEELKAHNISEASLAVIKEFNELVASGDKKAIDSAIRSTGEDGTNQIKKAVLNYGLNDKNPNFWRDSIGKAKKHAAEEKPETMVEAIKSKQNGNGAALHA